MELQILLLYSSEVKKKQNKTKKQINGPFHKELSKKKNAINFL